MRNINRRFWTAALAAIYAVTPLRAEDVDFSFFEREAVVVSATKYPRGVSSVPASAYVVTAADIENYGYRTLGEALQSVPGFYVTHDLNYSYIWVRGFGRPGDYNSRVLTLINGHRVNDNVYGGVFLGHDFGLDIKSVERMEVVKGPGSALHGDNAFFTVVNVVTKTPVRGTSAQVNAEGESHGGHKEYASLSQRFGDKTGLFVQGSYRRSDGRDFSYPAFGDAVFENGDREENATGFASLTSGGLTFQANVNQRKKQIPTAAFDTLFNDNGTQTTDSRDFAEVKYEKNVAPLVRLSGRLYHDWYSYEGDYIYEDISSGRFVNKDTGDARWVGEEVNLQLTPFGERNVLLVGQQYEKDLQARQQNYDELPDAPVFEVNQKPRRWAFFMQQEIWSWKRFGMTLGLRYDWYESFGKTINPRTALVFRPWQGGVGKLIYGTAFRAPSPFEMSYAGFGYKANPDLEPERIQAYEANFEQRLPDHHGTVGVSLFQNRVRDLISQVMDPDDGLLVYRNREKVRSNGIEAFSQWEAGRHLTGRAAYLLQKTQEENGDSLTNSPEHTGTLGVTRRWDAWRTRVGLDAFLVGRRRTVHGTSLPTATLLNLNVRTQPFSSALTLYAGLYNLADSVYEASGGAEHVQDSLPQGGRSFRAGLEYKFGAPF